jgi:hypothetical protein
MLLSVLGALAWLVCAVALHVRWKRPVAAAVCLGLAIGLGHPYLIATLGV